MPNLVEIITSLVLLLNKLVSLLPKKMCGKFFLYWPSGSREDENVKILQPDVRTTTGNQKAQES